MIIIIYCDNYKEYYSILPSVSMTAFAVSVAIYIYLKQRHNKERDRIKREFKNFKTKLNKFNDFNLEMSWFGPPPSPITRNERCQKMLEYYWNAKANLDERHYAFDYLVYLQYDVYRQFIDHFESYREDFNISQFNDWWTRFHIFSDQIECLHTCIFGIPNEIAKIYSDEFNRYHPEWRFEQMQNIWNYYKEFFPEFLSLRSQANDIKTRITYFKRDFVNAIFESNISYGCILIFGIMLLSEVILSLYMLQPAIRLGLFTCYHIFWITTLLFIIALISLVSSFVLGYMDSRAAT
ncbi:MAG: hypothetical protein ABR985_02580 [Methanotrichaceae archaeon]